MFKTAIHLLLAIQLAGCPVFCSMPSKVEDSHEQAAAQEHSGSHYCRASHDNADLHQDAPAPFSKCPCKIEGHDCICSGALVRPADFELSIVTHPFVCLPEPAGPIASGRTATPAGFLHTGCLSASDGRSLRALICSLLC